MNDEIESARGRVETAQKELADAIADFKAAFANAEDRLAMFNEELGTQP
ncbi:hypothetical protein [Nocardia sp. Marseille-Q1738]